MPYVNGIYTNPGWGNSVPPPINATNINDISNALADTTKATINTIPQSIAAVQAQVNSVKTDISGIETREGLSSNEYVFREGKIGWNTSIGEQFTTVIEYPTGSHRAEFDGSFIFNEDGNPFDIYYSDKIVYCQGKVRLYKPSKLHIPQQGSYVPPASTFNVLKGKYIYMVGIYSSASSQYANTAAYIPANATITTGWQFTGYIVNAFYAKTNIIYTTNYSFINAVTGYKNSPNQSGITGQNIFPLGKAGSNGVIGTYIGDGATYKQLTFDFVPTLVYIHSRRAYSSSTWPAIMTCVGEGPMGDFWSLDSKTLYFGAVNDSSGIIYPTTSGNINGCNLSGQMYFYYAI